MGRELGPTACLVVTNVRILRDRRGWSGADLAARMIDMPHPVTRAQLANLENGRRAGLSLDETVALAAALNVTPWWTLATDLPLCGHCRSDPPPGFVCTVCKLVGDRSAAPNAAPAVTVDSDIRAPDGGDGLFGPRGWEAFHSAFEQRRPDYTAAPASPAKRDRDG